MGSSRYNTGDFHNNDTGGSCYLATTIEDLQGSDELLRKFWEIENQYFQKPMLSTDEKEVMEHFKRVHYCNEKGMFIVPLPVKGDAIPLGESRMVAARKFRMLQF